jgi:hypothetical protein
MTNDCLKTVSKPKKDATNGQKSAIRSGTEDNTLSNDIEIIFLFEILF